MMELFGPVPETLRKRGQKSSRYFNTDGESERKKKKKEKEENVHHKHPYTAMLTIPLDRYPRAHQAAVSKLAALAAGAHPESEHDGGGEGAV